MGFHGFEHVAVRGRLRALQANVDVLGSSTWFALRIEVGFWRAVHNMYFKIHKRIAETIKYFSEEDPWMQGQYTILQG